MGVNRARRRQRVRSAQAPRSPIRLAAIGGTILLLAAIVAVVLINRATVPRSASEAPIYAPLNAGEKAPPFAVTTLDGRRIDSNAVQKPILLEVFATWCPHCQHETALLNALHARFGERLQIIAVSGSATAADRSSPESLDDVRGFARYFRVSYPIAFDPDLGVAKHYLQGAFPAIVFIDRDKVVRSVESGEVPLKQLIADAKKAGA